MSTPSDTPAPKSPSPLGAHPMEAAPKPAFKVTRSPFAPKITGQGVTGLQTGPISITAAAGPTPPKPTLARKTTASKSGDDEATPAMLALDFICAAVAIGAAVMIWLHSR
jgi:hypothetical protein